jgi:hypothetical protein
MPSPGALAVAEPAPLDGAVMAPRGAAANHCYAVPKPFEKIGAYAAEVLGKAAGEAIAAIANPRNALHPGIRRRTLDMLFPRERPLKLAIPDIKGPEAYDQALAVVHARSPWCTRPGPAARSARPRPRPACGWCTAATGAGSRPRGQKPVTVRAARLRAAAGPPAKSAAAGSHHFRLRGSAPAPAKPRR